MASRTKKTVKTTPKAKAKAKTAPSRAQAKTGVQAKKKTTARTTPKTKTIAKVKATNKAKVKPTPKAAKPATAKKPIPRAKPIKKTSPITKASTPRKKATAKKPAFEKKSPPTRETLTTLRAHVDAVEARLKRANSLTKSSVKAMQSAFTKLNERSGQASAAQEKEIVEYVEALNVHLTSLIDKTREDVAHDLQVVLDDPRIETIGDALTKANQRITRAETEQASALTAINEQISNLATVVDRRLRRDTEERERAQRELRQKIKAVETSSAEAVSNIGEKIVALADELTDRTDHKISAFKQELSQTDNDYKKEFEDQKSDIAKRIDVLEEEQRNSIPSIERRLVTIASRLDILETEKFNTVYGEQTVAPAFDAAPQLDSVGQIAPPPVQEDAFTPQPAVAYAAVTPPVQMVQFQSPEPMPMPMPAELQVTGTGPEPFAAPELSTEPAESHIPQEYVPQEYVPPTYPEPQMTAQTYAAPDAAIAPEMYTEANQEPQMGQPPMAMADGAMPPPFATDVPLMPPPEQTMDEARPGGDIIPEKKGGFLKLLKGGASGSAISGSPIKLFALMTGIAVIGLFAAQKIMPGPAASNPQIQSPDVAEAVPSVTGIGENPAFASNEPTPPVIESMDVVGDYSDTMQAPEIEPESNGVPSPAQVTLESAASNGDKVAQFQLGLSNLEAGRNEEAVRLIRLSANQGQPAAQYRLAKLYENGIGIEKDLNTAMQLLERSANSGNRIAMHDLGHYYATGAAMTQPDIDKAVTWFQRAAERGVLDSQFNLGVLYQEGSGVAKSPVDSYVWYAIAGSQGDPMAVQRAEVLAREMSGSQLEQAKSRVKAFVPAQIDDAANGVFKNLPWTNPAITRTAGINTNVKKVQELLSDLGYAVGSPDGAMGPNTRSAIIEFEKSNGLPETGQVSAELLDQLSAAAGV